MEIEFIDRYKSDESIISNTFRQLEYASDIKNKTAVLMLSEIEKKQGIASTKTLKELAKELDINGFYIINKNGTFLRSSDISIKLQHNSLFSYDPSYKNLIYGNLDIATTPIIPSYPYDVPAKLTMIPNFNKTLILESSTHLEYIENILHEVISADKNICSIGLYAPTGYELGSISSDGIFHQGRRNSNKKLLLNNVIIGNTLFISKQIQSNFRNCTECTNKKVTNDGQYYYILTFEVSISPLINQINLLRYQVVIIFLIMLILSVILSAWLSKKLVIRIKKINFTVNHIVEHKNLDSRVQVDGHDEIAMLANSFNKMIETLKISQSNLIEAEKKAALLDLATRVAHDIRSPIAAMEMGLQLIEERNSGKNDFYTVRLAIQRMRDIANNLLDQYRNRSMISPIFLKTLLEEIVLLKRYEWLKKNYELTLFSQIKETDQVIGDAIEIKRMLSNLLNNAIEACDYYAKIVINVSNINEFIHLDISDNGLGISTDNLDKCLNGKSFKHTGPGMGLLVAKKYMEAIGGKLLLISKLNIGTTVTLKFKVTSC